MKQLSSQTTLYIILIITPIVAFVSFLGILDNVENNFVLRELQFWLSCFFASVFFFIVALFWPKIYYDEKNLVIKKLYKSDEIIELSAIDKIHQQFVKGLRVMNVHTDNRQIEITFKYWIKRKKLRFTPNGQELEPFLKLVEMNNQFF